MVHALRHRLSNLTQGQPDPGRSVQMIRLTVRYARYALSMLSSVGFGTSFN